MSLPIIPNRQHQSSVIIMESTKGVRAFGTSSSNSMTNNRYNNIKRNDPSIGPPSTIISPIYSSENCHNEDVENQGRGGGRRKKTSEGFGGSGEARAFGRQLQTSSAAASGLVEKHHGWTSFNMRPNPHERLWNPSPSKKARSTSSSIISCSGRVVLGEKRIVDGEGQQRAGDDGTSWKRTGRKTGSSKENKIRSKYFPNITALVSKSSENQPTYSDFLVPQQQSHQPSSSADLNSSFTEKISNLDIGFGGERIAPSSSRVQFGQHVKEESYHLSSSNPNSTEVIKEHVNNNRNMGSSSRTISPLTSSSSSCSQFWHEHLDPDYPYITEILNYLHVLEVEHKVDPAYMGKQKEISFKMRTILVDWLVEVIQEYSISNATLHRCVQFIDRFLSKLQISRSNLQLLGTACLFIACKVEEIQPPETGDLVYVTDNTYDKSQLVHMECLVLSVLDFDLLTPTAYEFTEYFSSVLYMSPTSKEFSFYAVELTLLQGERFLGFSPSIIGLAGVYVGLWCCGDSRHVCVEGREREEGARLGSSNKAKAHHHTKNGMSVSSVLSRIKRLNPNAEFVRSVEEAALQMFVSILSVTSYNSQSSESNSVCTKYKKFQDQKYFRAATSAAACFSF